MLQMKHRMECQSFDNKGVDYDPVLLETYLPLVRRVVKSLSRNLPSHVDLDDLHSVGTLGLISAVGRYDPVQGNTFEAYALLRIRGAVLDELRRLDRMPRTARAKARKLQQTRDELTQRLGREPEEAELQRELGLDGAGFSRMKRQTQPIALFSLDNPQQGDDGRSVDLYDAVPDESVKSVEQNAAEDELIELLKDKIDLLPDRQKKILAMLYYEEMRLAEISEVFGVTEARICQIRNQAISNLRKHMKEFIDE